MDFGSSSVFKTCCNYYHLLFISFLKFYHFFVIQYFFLISCEVIALLLWEFHVIKDLSFPNKIFLKYLSFCFFFQSSYMMKKEQQTSMS